MDVIVIIIVQVLKKMEMVDKDQVVEYEEDVAMMTMIMTGLIQSSLILTPGSILSDQVSRRYPNSTNVTNATNQSDWLSVVWNSMPQQFLKGNVWK